MSLSAVAGIVDVGGGLRVVVTQRWRMRHHVKKGERLFVVPGLKVQEPVPWGQAQADLIGTVERHVQQKLAPTNHCGACRQCCKTLYINEDGLTKPSHTWCGNCTATGCGIYLQRPKPCRLFECLWLKSQAGAEPMAAELRPDKCGVIFTDDTTDGANDLFECHVDRMTETAVQYIDAEQAKGRRAKLITHYDGEPK